jgi:nitrate reductase gamma subunit
MSLISILFTFFFYFSALIFVVGVSYKLVQYWNTPAPLKIPIAPASLNKSGVILRYLKEIFLFSSLYKSNKWTWLFGWSFHFALVLLFFVIYLIFGQERSLWYFIKLRSLNIRPTCYFLAWLDY